MLNASGQINPRTVDLSSGSSSEVVIYFDPSLRTTTGTVNSGLVRKNLPSGTPTRINGDSLGSPLLGLDPCYSSLDVPAGGGNANYYTVNCVVNGFISGGNRKIYVDTSSAKINFFFVGAGPYLDFGGSSGLSRIHRFRSNLTSVPSNCVDPAAATDTSDPLVCRRVLWPNVSGGTVITAANRLGSFLELCVDRGYDCESDDANAEEEFAIRNLLNFYSTFTLFGTGGATSVLVSSSGTFRLSGQSVASTYNIYGPSATVTIGGSADYAGQLWINQLDISGNGNRIRTFSGGGGFLTGGIPTTPGTSQATPLVDFSLRSFTQASGF
ncbi:hypothetical protein [Synechococcus sp. GFB01]|uniref:hypothetical protein n=1 Tax=Synechococcus sp. GFB01 TaxID=1662190 RepID=UPI000B0C5A33|nr:hypothetical protein [Synechococcus sp. GFB01]